MATLETPFIVLTSNPDSINFLDAYEIADPFGATSECAKFTINDVTDAFGLKDITSSGRVYTISFWLKSSVSGFVRTTGGGTFKASSTWTKCASTFTATGSDFVFSFDTEGVYYIYHPQLEIGNKATDWSPAPEDMATNESVTELSTKYSELEQTVDGFRTEVGETYATKTTVNEVSTAAATAQSTADTAVSNAATAQAAADKAQEDVNTLTTTVTENYATKSEVTQTATEITQSVSETYSTKTEVAAIKIGAKNLIRNSENLVFSEYYFVGYLNPPEIYLAEVIDS